MKLSYLIAGIVLLLLGCSSEREIQPSSELERYILELPEVEVTQKAADIDKEKVTSILSTMDNSIPEKLIFIDHNFWSIHMAKRDGTLLDQKGRTGRGPGEYSGINDLYTYVDLNLLQVLDKKLMRLSYYDISADSLRLSHTVPLPDYEGYFLQSIFYCEDKTVGVFTTRLQHASAETENKINLFYLDEKFEQKNKILEIQGTELIEGRSFGGGKRYEENMFGNETVWSFYDNKLYYSNSENFDFSVYDFNDGTVSESRISGIPENLNTPEIIEYMTDRYGQIFQYNPAYEDYLKDRTTLPYFTGIYANDQFLYIALRNYGGERNYILRYNLESSEMERIETPPNYFMKGINSYGIYGMVVTDYYYGDLEISFLEFD